MESHKYRYEVGIRPLDSIFGNVVLTFGGNHVVLRLGTKYFEYGPDGVIPYNKEHSLEGVVWGYLGDNFTGTTTVSPSKLNEIINESGKWTAKKYNGLWHNCQDFVEFCLKKIEEVPRKRKKFVCFFQEDINPFQRTDMLLFAFSEPIMNIRKLFESLGKKENERDKYAAKMKSKINIDL